MNIDIMNIHIINRTHFIKSDPIKIDVTKLGLIASDLTEFELIRSKFNKFSVYMNENRPK